MIPPLSSFRVRNFQPATDISQLLSLLNDAEAIDHSGEDISEITVLAQLEAHDPQKDRWVIEVSDEPDVLIGHGAIWTATHDDGSLIAEVNLVIHPQWRRRGLGSMLFSSIENRAKDLGASYIRLYADPEHEPTVQFLTKKGFSAVAAYTEMRSMAQNTPVLLPDGFSIQPYSTINNPSLLVTAYNTCYAEQWGHHQVSLELIEQSLPLIDINGLFFMFAPDQTLVGMCRSEHSVQRTQRNGQATGYIDAPGVIPKFRMHQLNGALLSYTKNWLSENHTLIELESWGDSPETIEQYKDLEFVVLRQQYAYQYAVGENRFIS